MAYVWVALGGAAGAAARFGVAQLAGNRLGWSYPWGTLAVNIAGSLAIGLIMTVLAARQADPAFRLVLVTGFLGGFTTFSAFSFETWALLESRRWEAAVLYVAGSLILSFAACGAGLGLGRILTR